MDNNKNNESLKCLECIKENEEKILTWEKVHTVLIGLLVVVEFIALLKH